jgi:TolB-like protein/Flp pilus assembly protein TadD
VVLPLADLSQLPEGENEDPYLADSLTEELITHLGRLAPEQLGVISRVSAMHYKGTTQTVAEIGAELGVSHALEGSVRRVDGRLRVTAQLIQVSDQTHLWAETFDREDSQILDLESDVARRVSRALSLELLTDPELARRATRHPEAYRAFLEGRYHWNRFDSDGYLRAVDHLRRALALDPEFAEAWAALADAYNLLAFSGAMPQEEAFERAREAAHQALALDPELAEAHNSLAFVLLYGDWRPQEALEEFQRAVRLAPGYAMAHHWAAGAYAALGRFPEAVASAERALDLDPVSLSVRADLGWYYLAAGSWRQALEHCAGALDLSPGYSFALHCRSRAQLGLGDFPAVVESLRRDLAAAGVGEERAAAILDQEDPEAAIHDALVARRELWVARVERGEEVNALGMAWAHASVGELGDAFVWLDRAVEERDPWLVFLWADRRFEPLWGDPRFGEVATRVGIPAPWREKERPPTRATVGDEGGASPLAI